jgi:hypothetical protein
VSDKTRERLATGVWQKKDVEAMLTENADLLAWGMRAYETLKLLRDEGVISDADWLLDSTPKVIKEGVKA